MLTVQLAIYICAFIGVWFGAGLIVSSTSDFAKRLRLSSFSISFVLLGLLTSIPEFAVGISALTKHDPEIFVGNLLGGIPIIFLLITPVLAILGNGVELKHDFSPTTLFITLGAIAAPSILILDRRLTRVEGIFLILLYILLVILLEKKHGILDRKHTKIFNIKAYSTGDIVKILFGAGIIFFSSQLIVSRTILFSELLHIKPFYISLILLSLGTNLPEMSLAIRSVVLRRRDIAFGDYMGSAAANTLFFGVFTILSGNDVLTVSHFTIPFLFIVGGLALFYFFSQSKNIISRREGIILLLLYAVFVIAEFQQI